MKALYFLRKDLRLLDNQAIKILIDEKLEGILLFVEDPRDPLNASRGQSARNYFLSLMEDEVGDVIHYEKGRVETIVSEYLVKYDIKILIYQRQFEPWEVIVQEILLDLEVKTIIIDDFLLCSPKGAYKKDGSIYRVFKPFYENWIRIIKPYAYEYRLDGLNLIKLNDTQLPKTEEDIDLVFNIDFFNDKIRGYREFHDYPAEDFTSKSSMWINHGAISIRNIFSLSSGEDAYIRQLAWRDYYTIWLFENPRCVSENFKNMSIDWSDEMWRYEAWMKGETGYDLVDAAMHQLNSEGWINGRLRMLCASFLIKDLQVDWRLGERYFYEKLLDADLALNVGNWQWVAGTGAIAQPYFRVLSPDRHQIRFDREKRYINKYLVKSIEPIVDHHLARKLFIQKYRKD